MVNYLLLTVVPAKAGTQSFILYLMWNWIPACARMTT